MNLWSTFIGLLRRPIFTIPVIALAVAAGVTAYRNVPLRYQASASMVLTAPTSGGTATADPRSIKTESNPLLQFNDSLQTSAAILILAASTPEIQTTLGAGPGSGTRLKVDDGHTNAELLAASRVGPFLYITAESATPQEAARVVANVRQYIRDELRQRQDVLQAPKSTYITVNDVAISPAEAKNKTRMTATVGGPAAVLGLAFLLGLLVHLRRESKAGRRVAWLPADDLPVLKKPKPAEIAAPAPVAAVEAELLPADDPPLDFASVRRDGGLPQDAGATAEDDAVEPPPDRSFEKLRKKKKKDEPVDAEPAGEPEEVLEPRPEEADTVVFAAVRLPGPESHR